MVGYGGTPTMTDDDYYPTVREALFGNGHTANLYCAVKYIMWHLIHIIFAALGLIVGVGVILATLIHRIGVVICVRVSDAISRVNDLLGVSEQTQKTVNKTLTTASTKPVTRRVYNYCPVDVKQDPKWFSALTGAGKGLIERVEPPKTKWKCDGCDRVRDFEPIGGCHCDDHTEWREVKV